MNVSLHLVLKHLHVACVLISIGGFVLRGLLMLADSPLLRSRWLRVLPHVNDSLLLAAAIGLMALSAQYPIVHAWLTAKVFGVLAYIVLGWIALRAGRTKAIRLVAWLAALATFAYVVSVALTRNPAGFLAMV